jgi:hypothetical protein
MPDCEIASTGVEYNRNEPVVKCSLSIFGKEVTDFL